MRLPAHRGLTRIDKEWVTCPRCKNIQLKPDVIDKLPNGSVTIWWTCANFSNCTFPLDMPASIYQVVQTAQQAREGYFPLPFIKKLPERYRYLYPLTFQSSIPTRCVSSASLKTSTCDSGVSNDSIDRSECVSEPGMSEGSSSGANRLKSMSVSVQPEISQDTSSAPEAGAASTSQQASDQEDSDFEVGNENGSSSSQKKLMKPRRVVRRAVESPKSWLKLITEIANDKDAYASFIRLDMGELVGRLRKVINEQPFRTFPAQFSRKAKRTTFQLDEVDVALRQFPLSVDWDVARKKLTEMSSTYDNAFALKHATSGQGLLNVVGVNAKVSNLKSDDIEFRTEQRRKQLKDTIEQALLKLSRDNNSAAENEVKRRRMEEDDARVADKNRISANKAKMNAKARVMNKLRAQRAQFAPPVAPPPVAPQQLQIQFEPMQSTSGGVEQFQQPLQNQPNSEEYDPFAEFHDATPNEWIPHHYEEFQPNQNPDPIQNPVENHQNPMEHLHEDDDDIFGALHSIPNEEQQDPDDFPNFDLDSGQFDAQQHHDDFLDEHFGF